MIPIYKPFLQPETLKYAHEALDSTWISSQGKYIQMVEEKLQELLDVKHVIALNNGTSACHLVAKALSKKIGIRGNIKLQILVPDNVYAAAWNGFLFDKEYDLIPVSTDVQTWNFDLEHLDQAINNFPAAAVLVVHNVGNIINVPALQRKYPNTVFVEDNCEGFLGTYEGTYSGTLSLASSISFFGNKTITSGEGGALVTNDDDTYQYCKCVKNQGQSAKRFVHSELGYNYRMTNVQAAILYGQLERLNLIMNMKENVCWNYLNGLKDREDIFPQFVDPATVHSNWMFGVRIPSSPDYETAELYFKKNGVEIRPMFYPITAHGHLQQFSAYDCTNATLLNKECIILPSYPELSTDEQKHVLQVLSDYVKEI